MSGTEPATPQSRELEIMRVLFERRLKDRAIALADSRWPGAGKMVDLAYEWGQLEPAERRERLSSIGPAEIARLREFAELNPDLSKAVTELDRRGVLPHLEAAAIDVAAASREAQQQPAPETREEAAAPDPPSIDEATVEDPQPIASIEPEPEPLDADPVEETYDFEDMNIDELQVDMPNLDLGLPSTSEFLEGEEDRRAKAAKSADEAMERVRRSLDQATQRAFDRSASLGMPKMPDVSRPTLPSIEMPSQREAPDRSAVQTIDAPATLARHLEDHIVARIRPGDPMPTIDQLVSLANDLQVGFTEHTVTFSNRKEVFGGLFAEFGSIEVKPGSIPKAIAGPNLVVVHGRLAPQLVDRIEEGFFDIPGTKASVRVHPKARVVVLGDG
ncbi:MAG: hypothetical protein R3A46_09340 [Thermomicrobiales bacterium]